MNRNIDAHIKPNTEVQMKRGRSPRLPVFAREARRVSFEERKEQIITHPPPPPKAIPSSAASGTAKDSCI